jgi:hypothetical protein
MAPISIHECAVTEVSGFVEFSVPANRAANASIAATTLSTEADTRLIVRSKSLDQLTDGLSVDLMKIDVEGFEAIVLRGGEAVIDRSRDINIVIEWSLDQMRGAGFNADDMLSIFKRYDLKAYRLPHTRFLNDAEWASLELSADTLRSVGYDNVLLRRSA